MLINLFVGSYDCICKNGFEPGEEYCVDKNECTNGQSKCSEKVQKLLNNVNVLITYNRYYNNFNCILLIYNASNFKLYRLFISNLYLNKISTLKVTEECINNIGSYVCECLPGFERIKGECIDIDECSSISCGKNEKCTNSLGSYECVCQTGFERNSAQSCEDFDECSTNPCSQNENCENSYGSYMCPCMIGYERDEGW